MLETECAMASDCHRGLEGSTIPTVMMLPSKMMPITTDRNCASNKSNDLTAEKSMGGAQVQPHEEKAFVSGAELDKNSQKTPLDSPRTLLTKLIHSRGHEQLRGRLKDGIVAWSSSVISTT